MKIVVVNIYFGKRPGYLDVFLQSCAANQAVDFLFFVDFDVPFPIPGNVRFVQTTFQEIKSHFQSVFDFPIALESAYKLCDFRPAYGELFADYFKDYDWWGHCDFDMVFGDLAPVVDVAKQGRYVKIFRRGHLTLYRNTGEVNAVYKNTAGRLKYNEVFSTNRFCLFDETHGIDRIFTTLQMPVFREELIADISSRSAFLRMTMQPNRFGQYFLWSSGQLYCKSPFSNERTFIYVHLQKRRMAEGYRPLKGTDVALLINQFGIFDASGGLKGWGLRTLSLIPNIGHLWRFYVPRIIKTIKRKTQRDVIAGGPS